MDYKTRESINEMINEIAEALIEEYSIDVPIKNIDHVVNILGGQIEEDPRLSMYADGLIKKNDQGFIIKVSPYQTVERRNFTIAHELGHLFLHMGYKSDDRKWNNQEQTLYYRNGSSEEEYQANEFAAAFLMPKKTYKKVMDQYTTGSKVKTSMIAEHFNVSVNAASNRGKWLGYLRW